jgi:hypothetical protein
MRRRLGLVIVLGALVGATFLLHALADAFPVAALAAGPLEVALGTAARLLGLVIGYWLLASTVLYLLASLARLPAALRAVAPYTWRPLRRLIDGSVASSLALAMAFPISPPSRALGEAGAESAPGLEAAVGAEYLPIPDPDSLPEPPRPIIHTTTTTADRSVDVLYVPIAPAAETASVITDDRPRTIEFDHVVVMPGDSMWLLAERRLQDALGRTPGDHEVAPYWLAVIGANKDRIRSGDPDLIFPGEVLVLPGWELGEPG